MTCQILLYETCVGCGAVLPALDGPIHRYMTSSPACWAVLNALNDSKRPLAVAKFNHLIVDAYAAQHPGSPSNQAISSVSIHLMVLYAVLVRRYPPAQASALRHRPARHTKIHKHARFHWLTPPSFASSLTVADVNQGKTPEERSEVAEAWIKDVWKSWAMLHSAQVEDWFELYMASK